MCRDARFRGTLLALPAMDVAKWPRCRKYETAQPDAMANPVEVRCLWLQRRENVAKTGSKRRWLLLRCFNMH
jgi:hypothetical protein